MALYRILVKGRVQGVGFRATTQHFARENDITGNVRNNPDGTVEIRLLGTEDEKELMESFCRSGPSMARVEDVLVERLPETEAQVQDIKEGQFRIVG